MFIANTGTAAMRFNETGINSSGSLTKGLHQPPYMSEAREAAVNEILEAAKTENVPVGVIIHKVLSQSIPELNSFVQARGEVPSDDLRKLAAQAALLRASEIGMTAKILDTDDTDALHKIEESEQEHVEDNSGESRSILSPSTSAAIFLLVNRIKQRHKANGRSGNLKDFSIDAKKSTGANTFSAVSYGAIANNATGDEYLDEFEENYGPIESGGGSFWDNLFGNIDKIVDGITKTSGAINTTVGNVKNTTGGILDQITNIGGTVGSKSIEQYLAGNWWKILIAIVVLIIITIGIVRATRN